MITLTESAAEHLRTMLEEKSTLDSALRIFITRGGCAGLNYEMKIDVPSPSDTVAEKNGVRVIVDTESLHYLDGSTVDYCEDLTGTGFRIHNPNAARSCGCGTSFETSKKS